MRPAPSPDAATGTDLRRAERVFAAVILPIGPACVAALRYLLPYDLSNTPEESITQIGASLGRQSATIWLGLVAMVTLVPAVIWVGRVTKRQAPRLTAAALVLLVPAYTGLGILVTTDAIAWQGIREGHDPDTLADLFVADHPALAIGTGIFVAGHVLGTVLLGLALLRSGAVPGWAGIAVTVAQPLHFVAAVILTEPTLDLAAWGLNAIGFAAVSVAILRMPDDAWDLPPTRSDRITGLPVSDLDHTPKQRTP